MKHIGYYITLVVILLLASACSYDINERVINTGSGLGFPIKTIDIDSEAGQLKVPVLATREYEIISSAQWLKLPASGPAGRDGFILGYLSNTGLHRSGSVIVSISETNHRDTLIVRQKGELTPRLTTESPVISLKGSISGQERVKLDTNIPDGELTVIGDCEGESKWMSGVSVSGGFLILDYEQNTSSSVRRASVKVSYKDAFDNQLQIVFQIAQMSKDDSYGKEISIKDLCGLATEDGTTLDEAYVIEGIVVSDKANLNCGDNTQTSVTSIDYSVCQRTIYLETLDGSRGIMMLTGTADDNVFLQGDKVKFSLGGATIFKSKVIDNSPVYYWLSDVTGAMAVSTEHLGREGIPVKEKYMGSLSDDDIFTYVTLKDCELPVQKGSLTPISEKFTSVSGSNKINKFAVVLHDIFGSSMYLYTNTTCPYRRDGEPLPKGGGTMSGVVVHELFPRFSYMDNSSTDEDTWGTIGRYQLRHTTREDFGMKEADTFSKVICEWTYIPDKNMEKYYATAGDTQAYFTYSFIYPDSYTDGRAGKLPIIKYKDFSDLGPICDGYTGETPEDDAMAWATNLTARNGEPMFTTLVFSTSGLSASKMSVQLSSMNYFYYLQQSNIYYEGPRQWHIEYSLDQKVWNRAGSYSLPEFCQTTPMTQPWQTPGFKSVSVELPASTLMGKDKVYLRIIPDSSLATGSQSKYLDTSIKYPNSGSFPTAWNYISVRYNVRDAESTEFVDSGIDDMNPIDFNW